MTRLGLAVLCVATIFVCGRAGAQTSAVAAVQIPAQLPKVVTQAAVSVLWAVLDEYEDAAAHCPANRRSDGARLRIAGRSDDRSVAVQLNLAASEPLADIRSGLSQLKQD